jgi:RND family efflux transporter MFP subunit
MRRFSLTTVCAVVLGLAVLLTGCKKGNQFVPPPPPKVSVAKPLAEKITRYLNATGNTTAVNSVDLVARVEGFLQGISFTDGAEVKAGDTLFTIEPLPYQAKLQQAQAAEDSANAQLVNAEFVFNQQQSLQRNSVASVTSLEAARATRDTDRANLAQARATTQLAAITYAYTRVLAPFDGRMSAHLVSVGSLVGTTPTILATIVQIHPIYATFTVSEQDVQRIRERAIKDGLTSADIDKFPIEIGLQGETGYPHTGHLDYVAPTVDPTTGTLIVRGILDNANGLLLPGYFVRVRVPMATGVEAMLVPDVALSADQGGVYVLVVGKDNIVEQRHVTTGPLEGRLRVIEKGLTLDDLVVVNGLQRAVPGQEVEPATVSTQDVPQ